MPTEKMLSVAEVCELQAGTKDDPTWINPGFQGVVLKINSKKTKTNKDFFPCIIGDTTGSAEVEVSFFTRPKFTEGDLIELDGSLRRTEFNGKAQAAIGQATAIRVLGKSAHAPEQAERKANLEPSVNGAKPHIAGQTVGMAMKEAIALVTTRCPAIGIAEVKFWEHVHVTASDIIRVSNALEHGNLAPSATQRLSPPTPPAQDGRSEPPKGGRMPEAGPGGSVKHEDNDDEVPF